MIEVHPPEEKIHGFRDFLLHLFTITIGLLIALGLEGAVESWHHVGAVVLAVSVITLGVGLVRSAMTS